MLHAVRGALVRVTCSASTPTIDARLLPHGLTQRQRALEARPPAPPVFEVVRDLALQRLDGAAGERAERAGVEVRDPLEHGKLRARFGEPGGCDGEAHQAWAILHDAPAGARQARSSRIARPLL